MLLSIITINYNNAGGLAKTLASVKKQSFTQFEYFVIDGGSVDGSRDVIASYSDIITRSISEKDNGVYHAMNKGLQMASGQYVLFLNSGDYLSAEDVLTRVFSEGDLTHDIVFGDLLLERNDHVYTEKKYPDTLTFGYFYHGLESLPHPSTFIRRALFAKTGFYSENFKIISDWEFVMKAIFLFQATYIHLAFSISVFNMDGISSSPQNESVVKHEKEIVYNRYFAPIVADYMISPGEHVNIYEITSVRKSVQAALSRRWDKFKKWFQ